MEPRVGVPRQVMHHGRRGGNGSSRQALAASYTLPMASKGLTECWRDAWAAKPSNWRLMGVVCGPREADPKIHSSEERCAWARGPDKERLEGCGDSSNQALVALAVHLKGLSR